MTSARDIVGTYRSLGVLLVLVALAATLTVTSCGSGGGDADGGLCSQCGNDPDGPCLLTDEVTRGPDAPKPCDSPGDSPCSVLLTCNRELGSAQRRCYPGVILRDPRTEEDVFVVQRDFECDGARPNVSTPFPTTTPTLSATDTPDPNSTSPSPDTSPDDGL